MVACVAYLLSSLTYAACCHPRGTFKPLVDTCRSCEVAAGRWRWCIGVLGLQDAGCKYAGKGGLRAYGGRRCLFMQAWWGFLGHPVDGEGEGGCGCGVGAIVGVIVWLECDSVWIRGGGAPLELR